jgi:hypothetical protein
MTQALTGRVCAALRSYTPLPDRLNLNNDQGYQMMISMLLVEEIKEFDREIVEAVLALCKKPMKLTETQAQDLVQNHSKVLSQAYHSTVPFRPGVQRV